MSYETTTELRDLLQEEVGDTTPSATTQARYVALLDAAHKAVVGGGGELNLDDTGNPIRRPFVFPWALEAEPLIINLLPKQSGTAAVTIDSNSATIDINSGTTDLTGYHIRFGTDKTVYKITLHSALVVTLDSTYVDATDASIAFDAFKLQYTVGASTPLANNILLPADEIRVYYQKTGISVVDLNELQDQYPLRDVVEGNPILAAVAQQGDGTLVLQFNSFPKERERAELRYVAKPATLVAASVDPILPKASRRVLAYLAAFYHLRKRDDDRARSHLETARQLFNALTTDARQVFGGNDAGFGYVAPWPGGFQSVSNPSGIEVDIP